MRKVWFGLFAFVLLGVTASFAKPASGEVVEPPPVYFFVYGWPFPDTMDPEAFFSERWKYQTPEVVRDVALRDGELSSKLAHKPGVPIVLFQETLGADGLPIQTPRIRVSAEEIGNKQQILIIFFPLAQDLVTGLYPVKVVDLSLETLPMGSVKILNLSDRDVFGMFGEENFRLPRFQEHVSRIPAGNGGLFTARFAAHIENKPQFVYSTRRRLRPDQSYLMLLLNEKKGGRLSWRAMSFGGLQYDAPSEASTGD